MANSTGWATTFAKKLKNLDNCIKIVHNGGYTNLSKSKKITNTYRWSAIFVKKLKYLDNCAIKIVHNNGYIDLYEPMINIRGQMNIVKIYQNAYPDDKEFSNEKLIKIISRSFIRDRPGMEQWFNNCTEFSEALQLYKDKNILFIPKVQRSINDFCKYQEEFESKIFNKNFRH